MSRRPLLVRIPSLASALLLRGAICIAGIALLTTGCESEESRNARLMRGMEAPPPEAKADDDIPSSDVSHEDIEAWLGSYVRERSEESPPPVLTTTVPEKQWRVTFPGRLLEGEPMQVEIALHPAMAVLMAPLLTLPASTSRDLLASLLVQNYELYQSKLSLSPDGRLFASYEVPNRLLDRRELLENLEDLTVLGRNIAPAVLARLGEEAAPAPVRQLPPTPPAPAAPHAAVPVE